MEEGWLQFWCYSYRRAITSEMSADPVPLSNMHVYSATLPEMHAWFIYSDTRVCKVLLYQARHLVCHKSIRHVYRQGAAPTGL